jgi:hypothetical protein
MVMVVAYSRYYLGIYLEELRKITKCLSQDKSVPQPRFELSISRYANPLGACDVGGSSLT